MWVLKNPPSPRDGHRSQRLLAFLQSVLSHFMSNQNLVSIASNLGIIGDIAFSPFRNISCHMGEIVSIYVTGYKLKTPFFLNLTLNYFWRKHIYVDNLIRLESLVVFLVQCIINLNLNPHLKIAKYFLPHVFP